MGVNPLVPMVLDFSGFFHHDWYSQKYDGLNYKVTLQLYYQVELWYFCKVRLQDYSMSLNRIMHTQKWYFRQRLTSKLNRIWVKFSKMKVKTFNNDLSQRLSRRKTRYVYEDRSFINVKKIRALHTSVEVWSRASPPSSYAIV